MFSPGELVVCINDTDELWHYKPEADLVGDLDGLRRGEVYTIREELIWTGPALKAPVLAVRLAEITRTPEGDDPGEPPFMAWRFRPVSRTSSELFASLLNPLQREKVSSWP